MIEGSKYARATMLRMMTARPVSLCIDLRSPGWRRLRIHVSVRQKLRNLLFDLGQFGFRLGPCLVSVRALHGGLLTSERFQRGCIRGGGLLGSECHAQQAGQPVFDQVEAGVEQRTEEARTRAIARN